ncbi:MAG: tRNA-dihydrouridine synthase family protein [Nanoarchaeota archaeon]|nr:tRNA-dihydrouridine synthase family protein [Nanoarchaeota archaeon]MBU1631838.1 tRNA-dihydrouridine synthase family protein [Nanoarchaeota archaeon]MBU1875996.1 tRNA-dihydrouridine synthase family protein [Nanoarchaeota archaeon]
MKDFEVMLAPMENHTNPEFRELCYNKGASSTFTEMARISALARGNKSTLEKIKISDSIPTYIQLIGSNEKDLDKFLQNFKPQIGFLGFNLNLGCPSPEMVQKGLGCALIKRISKVKKLIQIIRDYGYPVSIKLRLGMNKYEKEKKVYLNLINEVDADFFIVHARHGKETYKDPADFDIYKECVKTSKIIIANGDIKTKKQIEYLKSIGVRGVMIGRAAIKNPDIFNNLT